MSLKPTTWARHFGDERDKRDAEKVEKKAPRRDMADHPWEPGAYGTCRRCGTDPNTSFPRERHPKP